MASGAVYRAKVTRAGVTGVYVKISAHWPGVEFGPLDLVGNSVRLDLSPAVTGMADYIKAGDDVLVIETGPSDFLVIGTIRNGVSSTGGL